MALNREVVNQVKERADIVQVVGERVALSPSGDGYMGLCPFHPEKTPSFRVSPSRRMFHCFGCSAGGSVIDFVMHSENMEFGEAVESLAARFGVALPSRGQTAAGDRAVEVLEAARKYYSGLLLSSPLAEGARSYLSGRDFSRTGWEAFSLGFAPEGWQNFCDHARRLGFSESDLLASGLARRGKSGSLYDMLRKRVVFPILNEQGRPIAFGGRIIDPADQPKYLNTPETRLYQKSRVLFGFSLGREQFRKTRRALLTEGYLDVIRLHEHGFTEAVATCGTALSADHLKLLERHVRSAVLVFDGDDAGIKAALRSAPLFLERGLEARVCLLPDGQDPDDFLRKNGPQAFQALLEESGPLLEFLGHQLLERHGRTVVGKERTLQELQPMLASIRKSTARDVTVRFVADLVGVGVETVQALARGPGLEGTPATRPSGEKGRKTPPSETPQPLMAPRETRHPRRLMRLLLEEHSLVALAREMIAPGELGDASLKRLYEKLLRLTDEEMAQVSPEELLELWPDQAPLMRSLLVEEEVLFKAADDPGENLRYEINKIKQQGQAALFRQMRNLAGQAPSTDMPGLTEDELAALERIRRSREEVRNRETFRRTHKLRPEVTVRPRSQPAEK